MAATRRIEMVESHAGLGILAIVLLATGFVLMFRFLRFWGQARQEHRRAGGSWPLAVLLVRPGDHGKTGQAATKALWSLIGLTFVFPATATIIEKGATLFGKPVRLPSGQPMPPIFLELCSAMFAATALVVCLVLPCWRPVTLHWRASVPCRSSSATCVGAASHCCSRSSSSAG